MIGRRRTWMFAMALGAALLMSCGGAQRAPRAPWLHASGGPTVAAWVVPYDDSLKSLEANASAIDIVSPTYHRIKVEGTRTSLEDWDPNVPFPRARLRTLLSAGKVRAESVLPLVGCIGPCGPRISRVLDDAPSRAEHVRTLASEAEREGLGGIFVDYEDVDAREASVTAFVVDLASALHARGKRLGLVVQEPCGAAKACARSPYPFALRTLADAVDVLAIMEYDYAVDGSAPPAPRAWVSKGLEHVARAVETDENRRKTLCALPLYGRVSAGLLADTAILHSDYVARRDTSGKAFVVERERMDEAAMSLVVDVNVGGSKGTAYVENAQTNAMRLALTKQFGLGGVALWRLGGEDPCGMHALVEAAPCASTSK